MVKWHDGGICPLRWNDRDRKARAAVEGAKRSFDPRGGMTQTAP